MSEPGNITISLEEYEYLLKCKKRAETLRLNQRKYRARFISGEAANPVKKYYSGGRCLADIVREHGLNYNSVHGYIKRGHSLSEALELAAKGVGK